MLPSQPRSVVLAWITIALIGGTAAAEVLHLEPSHLLLMAWGLLSGGIAATAFWSRQNRRTSAMICLITTVALLAAIRWSLIQQEFQHRSLHQLAMVGPRTVVLQARVSTVPLQVPRQSDGLTVEPQPDAWQTRFTADCRQLVIQDQKVACDGTIRVTVDGAAADRWSRGDIVLLTGVLLWPKAPGNPGEFDYATRLRQQQIAGLLYVDHPDAVQLQQPVQAWHPAWCLTRLRRAAQAAVDRSVPAQQRAIATALLLGTRAGVATETEEVFIGSGTMHLLAISGLHIGILCVLLNRMGHLLLIPWSRRLLLIAGFCLVYAFVTDLRPSVVRATLFVLLFAASQVCLRRVSMFSTVSQTATLIVLWQPGLALDTGAWLSFLSVLSLAWAVRDIDAEFLERSLDHPAPLTFGEWALAVLRRLRYEFLARYRPLLWILLATTPVTIATFHVLAPIALLINVVLILYTAVTLWAGFVALAWGMLLPEIGNVAGWLFARLLAILSWCAESAAGVGVGHQYLADLPLWFLPAWYAVLLVIVLATARQVRQTAWIVLLILLLVPTRLPGPAADGPDIQATILSVGHGSAALIQDAKGNNFLVDAGAMHRGQRAADIICRAIWASGCSSLNGVLISHADADHYNALGLVLRRIPVGELLVAEELLSSRAAGVQRVLQLARRRGVPIRVVTTGEHCQLGDTRLNILQASPRIRRQAASDNECSLVVRLTFRDRQWLFPGDLEGPALAELLPRLGPIDVLVSPHHGSRKANLPGVNAALQPQHVVVSTRSDSCHTRLVGIYPQAKIWLTSDSGAIVCRCDQRGQLRVFPWRNGESPRGR